MTELAFPCRHHSAKGFTIVELVVVLAIIITVSAISAQQLAGARRIMRSAAVARTVVSALRDARQMAISQRRAITFQYDDANKQINIINHGADANGVGISGLGVLTATNYPNTTSSSVERTYPLVSSGLPASDIKYGLPSLAPNGATTLDDKTTLTALTNNRLNITFQPDGTVVNNAGVSQDAALFIYNGVKPLNTAMAISVLGGTGRIKLWRYSSGASKYVE